MLATCSRFIGVYAACRVRQYAFYACPPRGKALRGMAYGKLKELKQLIERKVKDPTTNKRGETPAETRQGAVRPTVRGAGLFW